MFHHCRGINLPAFDPTYIRVDVDQLGRGIAGNDFGSGRRKTRATQQIGHMRLAQS